ncbi:MAG: tetratricopeptide repeat protein [Bacteroidales bacterium]|nr:tetratricopeptide repeat protein [Bacteroidales bacterium]
MKHNRLTITIILLLMAVATPTAALHAATDSRFADGNSCYEAGDYEGALANYRAIVADGQESWELHYNMGNAYYRLDSLGKSILSYERALRLAPTSKEVKENLALAYSKTADRIEVLPTLFLVEWFRAVVGLFTPRGWRIACVVMMVLVCAALCLFLIAQDYKRRRSLFIISALLGFLLLLTILNATFSAHYASHSNEAIVTDAMVVVKGSPDGKSVDKFVLHEGTKVKVTDQQDQWWQIELSDGKSGWISGGAEGILEL